jgi:hypothetical protein
MKAEIKIGDYNAVAPYSDMYGHGPVIFIQNRTEDHDIEDSLWVCLDCGYTADDNRMFLHAECSRENNRVNTTMGELVEEDGYPEENNE